MHKHILLIDDDPDEYDLFIAILVKMTGIRCSYASSARQGLQVMLSDRPDLVFLDVNMPVVDGVSCLSTIKETTALQTVPVVIYSTNNDLALRQTALQLGAKDCVRKPVNMGALETMLQGFCSELLGS